MSAEQSRLRSAIQRIAKEDPELRGAIDAAKSRGEQPGGLGVGESDGERDRICCDGSTSDNANPGSDTRDPNESAKDGLDPDDPADISDNLTGVVDCATGQPICFEGSDWMPPEGWDDSSTGPVDPTYQDGIVYSGLGVFGRTHAEALVGDGYHLGGTSGSTQYEFCKGATPVSCDSNSVNVICGGGCFAGGTVGNFDRTPCSAISDPDGLCDKTADDYRLSEEWPEDGCVNLSIKGGSIVGSKYDPENDGSYSAPRDEIELCDPETGDSILIRPSADGGWKSIESLDGDIDPDTGNGYLYAPDGKRIRQISPSEFRDDMV